MTPPSIELAHIPGCPHADEARRNLAAALRGAGLQVRWTEWDLESPSTPARVRTFGSPTVLVDGRDVTGAEQGVGARAPACRVEGAPTVEQIAALLVR
jgi:hypothetical protein